MFFSKPTFDMRFENVHFHEKKRKKMCNMHLEITNA